MDQMTVSNRNSFSAALPKAAELSNGSGGGFIDALQNAVKDVTRLQQDADKAILDVQSGNSGSLHHAVIALEKADVSFRTMLQVRNRLLEAYQEIMRMQV